MIDIQTTNVSVANATIIPLETTHIRIGNTVTLNGNTLVINAPGTYKVELTETGTLAGAGNINATMYINGVASTIASATQTLDGVGSGNIAFNTILNVKPSSSGNVTLSFYNTGLLTTINQLEIIVTRISPLYN